MNITLKKIVNTALSIIIIDLLLLKLPEFFSEGKIYPTFKRLHKISSKLRSYR